MYDFGGDVKHYRDFWDNEDPLTYFPWVEDKTKLKLFAEQTEREYYLSQIPQEFHSAVDSISYDHGHAGGESEVVGIIADLVGYLAPCIKEYRENLLSGLDDKKFD
jgi:hypothetical protein